MFPFQSHCVGCRCTMLRTFKCTKCGRGPLCSNCVNNAVCEFPDEGSLKGAKAVLTCRPCFIANVDLDFSRQLDEYGPAKGTATTVLLVHGGGGCRFMYADVAQFLAEKGYHCVCPDLPGHGSKLNDPLSIDSCCQWLKTVVDEYCPPSASGVKPIYLGGSFGGYTGMEMVGRYPNLFSAAIIISASQSGRSFAAKAAVTIGRVFARNLMCSTLVGQMLAVVAKHPHLPTDFIQKVFRHGFYLQEADTQMAYLQAVNPNAALKHYGNPIMFMDGAKDYHDNRAQLLDLAMKNERAALSRVLSAESVSATTPPKEPMPLPLTCEKIYDDADHFFSHDKRHHAKFLEDVVAFIQAVEARLAAHPNLAVTPQPAS
jgi:pimeloyl-ACP methyl ester carboxylesterase